MASRTPLKLDGTNVREMASSEYDKVVERMTYLYFTDPSVTLSQVGASGTLSAMSDTRTQAGSATSDATNFHTAAETPDVGTVTVSYDKISMATASLSAPADTNNIRFPCYVDGTNVKAMTLQEMYDTYSGDVIDAIIAAQPYKIHTSTTPPSGYTNVSTTAVFTDTRADAAAYTAGGIGETQDQPTTITNYYLHKANGTDVAYTARPMYINGSQNLQEYTSAEFDAILKEVVRYTTVNLASHKVRYYIDGSGTSLGSGMVNTKLNSSTYQTLQVGDDYRSQEFPAGSAATISTYYLKARKE
tara:strand:+ start:725 stop:1630 length:906 start_codon:yes stop_codon:yes gene_type:complete